METLSSAINWIFVITNYLAWFCVIIVWPICLVMAIFSRSRMMAGLGLYHGSTAVGFNLWLFCAVLVWTKIGVFWAIFGFLLAGVGVVGVAIIGAFIKGHYSEGIVLLISTVAVMTVRFFGAWLASKAAEESE